MPRNKTVISAILLICTVLSLAAPACCEEDPYLTSITLTEDRGHDQSPAIPDSIDGNPVTRIGERCFTGIEEDAISDRETQFLRRILWFSDAFSVHFVFGCL